jgi:RHS repeat-associated protein
MKNQKRKALFPRMLCAVGYVNDAVGRRTSMSRSGGAYTTADVISYSYNDRSELVGASSNMDAIYSYSYSYDPIGNRVAASEAGVPWTYTTNSLNQYTSATESNVQLDFAYDLDGSMTCRPVDGTSGWTQVWNGENRMVETFKGGDRLTFKYGTMGRRVEKCVYSNNTLTSRTLYVYDGFKCVEELDALDNNAVTLRHTWQPFDVGLDVILATKDASGTSYFLHDANKNVMQKTSANGTLQETYTYAPFGENLGTYSAHVGFSSEVFDNKAELIYYNHRYLTCKFSKWICRDSIEENGGHNLYGFCFNNSVNHHDFLGMEVPALDSVSANPSISLDLLYDDLIKTFHMSRDEIMKRVARCTALHAHYKSLNCRGCSWPCISKIEAQNRVSCLAIEVAERSTYLGLKCDYFLLGSVIRGTEIAMKGHIEQLALKSTALATCALKAYQ